MKLVAIFSSLLIIAGTVLANFKIGSLIPYNDPRIDGIVVLLYAILILFLSLYDQLQKKSRFGKVIIVCGLSCFIMGNYDLIKAYNSYEAHLSGLSKPILLTALYFIIGGSIVVTISGIFLLRELNKTKIYQHWVAGFIANRIAFNQQRSFSRFIIRLSIVATVISVAVMIITLAFANGFQEEVSQKVFSFWGHVRIQEKQPFKALIAEETPIIKDDALIEEIKKDPGIENIHPFATKYAILKTKDEIEGVLLKGFDNTYDFSYLKRFITKGRHIQFNDSSYSREIVISTLTAKQLKLDVNDKILIYFIRPDGSLRPDKLTVTGIFKTGIEDYDKTFAIGDIQLIQRLNAGNISIQTGEYKNEIGGYEIFLKNYKDADKVSNDIYGKEDFPPTWDAQSVQQISPNIFDWLNMQDVTRNVLIGCMLAVAIINLITCLLILVLERIQMIGVLKSLGATNWTVQKIFVRHSAIITITGIILGTAIGLGVLYLQKETGFIKLKEEAYYLSKAAVKIVWWQVGAICGGTLLVCFLVLMIPSVLVRKIQPVKAIQFR